ncbi:unnamed protein product [Rhodiola kirilowii]
MDPELSDANLEALNKLVDDAEKLNQQWKRIEESMAESLRIQAAYKAPSMDEKLDRMIALLEKMMPTPKSESEPELCVPVEMDMVDAMIESVESAEVTHVFEDVESGTTAENIVVLEVDVAAESGKEDFGLEVDLHSDSTKSAVIGSADMEVTSDKFSVDDSSAFLWSKDDLGKCEEHDDLNEEMRFEASLDDLISNFSFRVSGVCRNDSMNQPTHFTMHMDLSSRLSNILPPAKPPDDDVLHDVVTWNIRLDRSLQQFGFKRRTQEQTVYTKKEKFKEQLMKEFEMNDLGKLSYYLGIEVEQSAERITLKQSSYEWRWQMMSLRVNREVSGGNHPPHSDFNVAVGMARDGAAVTHHGVELELMVSCENNSCGAFSAGNGDHIETASGYGKMFSAICPTSITRARSMQLFPRFSMGIFGCIEVVQFFHLRSYVATPEPPTEAHDSVTFAKHKLCYSYELFYAILIHALGMNEKLYEALLSSPRPTLTPLTYNAWIGAWIGACAGNDDLEKSLNLMSKMRRKLYSEIESDLVECNVHENRPHLEPGVAGLITKHGFVVKRYVVNLIIKTWLQNGEISKATELFRLEGRNGLAVDVVSYNTIINGLCKAKKMEEARNLFIEMDSNNCSPNLVTHSILVDGPCKSGKVEEAMMLLNKYELLSYSLQNRRPSSLPPENDLKIGVLDEDVAELEIGVDSLFESSVRFHSHMLSVGQIGGKIGNHACFNIFQREAIKDARRIAGLEVSRSIDEHTMIFMEYEFEKKNIGAILVFDPGGGIILGAASGIAYPHMQELENRRVQKTDNFIQCGRLSGILNLAKAIRGSELKQNIFLLASKHILSVEQDVRIERCDDYEFLIPAGDESWDCMSSKQLGSEALLLNVCFQAYRFEGDNDDDHGTQAVWMGGEAKRVPAAAKLFKKGNDILGFDLVDLSLNGPKDKLNSEVISQPTIYVTSLVAGELYRAREGGRVVVDSGNETCDLSLGEYTAVVVAEAFNSEDGLVLKMRGEATPNVSYAPHSVMVGGIGLDSEEVRLFGDSTNKEIDEANRVQIANYPCTDDFVVSEGVKGIKAFEGKAKSYWDIMKKKQTVPSSYECILYALSTPRGLDDHTLIEHGMFKELADLAVLARINNFFIFSSPRPPEIADLEDKVNFKREGMLRIGILCKLRGLIVFSCNAFSIRIVLRHEKGQQMN